MGQIPDDSGTEQFPRFIALLSIIGIVELALVSYGLRRTANPRAKR